MSAGGLQAVVFDLDGVLIDSERVWDAARRAVVEETGGRWREGATEEMIGMSSTEWSRHLHERLAVPLAPQEINRRVVEHVLAAYSNGVPLLPGAVGAVRALAAVWPLGVASSANRTVIEAVLGASELDGCFQAIVSAEEVDRGKPSPDVYLAAAAALDVAPAHTAAIEDSANGLRSAAAAGMLVVAVPNRDFPPEAEALALAQLTLASLRQLTPRALASIGGGAVPAP